MVTTEVIAAGLKVLEKPDTAIFTLGLLHSSYTLKMEAAVLFEGNR
jgi:hypothetical protein